MNLIEGIQEQQRRVRNELLPAYKKIGQAGAFGSAMLKAALDDSDKAIASGDVVAMVEALKVLKECK